MLMAVDNKIPTKEEANCLRETAQEHAGSYIPEDAPDLLLSLFTRPSHISLQGEKTRRVTSSKIINNVHQHLVPLTAPGTPGRR